jgi:hypothetical protein
MNANNQRRFKKPAKVAIEATVNNQKKATTTMKKMTSGAKRGQEGISSSQLIDVRIDELEDWQSLSLFG